MNLTGSDEIVIDICHRISPRDKQDSKRARNVMTRFNLLSDKHLVLRSTKKPKAREPPMFINDQYPRDIECKHCVPRPIVNTSKGWPNCHAILVKFKIIFKEKGYSTDTTD